MSPVALRTLWTLPTTGTPKELYWLREKGGVLARDDANWLYLVNRKGERQAQVPAPASLAAAAAADDGSAFATVGKRGEVWWLAPDLRPLWQRSVPNRPLAAALDPFGQYLAVADASGNLYVLNRRGRPVAQSQSPRPLHFLAFVPEAPAVVGAADYGLVASFDLKGRCAWRDGLVANVGSLATSGDGGRVLLACFSEGLCSYALSGPPPARLAQTEPCRLAALTFDGGRVLAVSLSHRLLLLDREGRTVSVQSVEKPPCAVALDPLGHTAVAALADRRLVCLDLRRAW